MKLAVRLVLLALLGALGFWLWTVLFPSPEKIVLKKVAALAANANVGANDSNIVRAGKASNVVGQFANDAEIIIDVAGVLTRTFSGRDEIREAAIAGFGSIPSLKITFQNTRAKVAPDKESATVTCTANVSAGDSKDFGIQELRFLYKKIDGDWRIARVETIKTLQ